MNRSPSRNLKIRLFSVDTIITIHYFKNSLQVLESSAKLKLEFDESVPLRAKEFSLLESLLFFFCSLDAIGTHLYIFMVVSPIVTHFFSLKFGKHPRYSYYKYFITKLPVSNFIDNLHNSFNIIFSSTTSFCSN